MNNKKIAILMATFNGEKFLQEQIVSIVKQSYQNWYLYVMDDGSHDKTWDLLIALQNELGTEKMTLMRQKNQGSAPAFLALLCDNSIAADYYAYADQDDIWDADKLARTMTWLTANDNNKPLLYCANVRLADINGTAISLLPAKKKPFCFRHALAESIGTGNTMVFNLALRKILLDIGKVELKGGHDWWTYLVVTAFGGLVYYDVKPVLLYRQHAQNLVGFSDNRFYRYKKSFKRILNNDFKSVNDYHILALNKINDNMTPAAKQTFAYFKNARIGNVLKRVWCLYRSGIYRQDWIGTCGIYIASFLRKL